MLVKLFGLLFVLGSFWMLATAWIDFKRGSARVRGVVSRRTFRRDENEAGFWTVIATNAVLGVLYLIAGVLIVALAR